jgi:hypothetical protein
MAMIRVKTKTYEGNKDVLVVCTDCPKFQCFQPHNFNRYGEKGHKKEDWRCQRNYNYGCPANPKEIDTNA